MEWEGIIPFLPWFIIPYMSIDLFFVVAPFLCHHDKERHVLSRRIAAAILASGVFFLVMPLRFSFERPHVDGLMGLIFNNFREIDLPFNQFPSLHIALAMILVIHYRAHSRGVWHALVSIWFVLVAVSTIFTYQHHLIDILGGLVLGTWCFYLFPSDETVTGKRNRRVALYYASGVLALVGMSVLARPWTLLLLWPALSLATVALAYNGLGPWIYRKSNGSLPWSTRLLHAPMLIGQTVSAWHYARRSDAWNPVTPQVWIGRRLTESEAQRAVADGVTAVLDLTSEFGATPSFKALVYRQLPILDLTAPTAEQVCEAVDFITCEAQRGVVYVHCKVGYSRSGAIMGAYLIASGECADADAALARLRSARPGIVIRPEAEATIREFAQASKKSGGR
jgi:protein-tyrosine phosphatase